MSLPIAIAGAAGRMGRALIRAASARASEFRIVGGTANKTGVGQDLGALAGLGEIGVKATTDTRAAATGAAVWIDFTTPAATITALGALPSNVRAAIVGTTGFSADDEPQVTTHAQRIALVRSGNFSLGVNLLAALTEETARRLGADWDIEIVEAHHRHKTDSPSGTASMLGRAASAGRGAAADKPFLPESRAGARPKGGIGFASIRAGGIVGEHDVIFANEREVLTLSHQALDRAIFADGALAAALWATDKSAGAYSMRDVLGFQ